MLDQTNDRLTADDLSNQLNDIQGGLLREYSTLAATFAFFRIEDPAKARAWLADLLPEITRASEEAPTETLNIAISALGLIRFGLSEKVLGGCSVPFLSGMALRADQLGDVGPSAPKNWQDGFGSGAMHVMVSLTGPDAASVEALRSDLEEYSATQGVIEISHIDASVQFEQRTGCPAAHFGYVDPISQPAIAGLGDGSPGDGAIEGDGWRPIQPGEFLLGYENELGEVTAYPGPREFGVNGTYIAFRKIDQNVVGFREFLKSGAASLWGSEDPFHQELMAAKIVGRWRSGCPLAVSPDKDDFELAADPRRVNAFDHADDDEGLNCPLGAHIRRMNPRKTKLTTKIDINRKRILRRGLEYGPPLPEGAPEDGLQRGQVGVLVCADLDLQFEFLQSEWINKGDFLGLPSDERDPLIGSQCGGGLTVPGADMPFLFDIKQLVTIRGGEYFFAPSLTALRGIAARKF